MIAVIKNANIVEILQSDAEALSKYNLKINKMPVTINNFTFTEVVKPPVNKYQDYSNNVTMINGVPTREVIDMPIEKVRKIKIDEVHADVASAIDGMSGSLNEKLISLSEMVMLLAKVTIANIALSPEEETRANKLLSDGGGIKAIITARDNTILEIETENEIEALKAITFSAPA